MKVTVKLVMHKWYDLEVPDGLEEARSALNVQVPAIKWENISFEETDIEVYAGDEIIWET